MDKNELFAIIEDVLGDYTLTPVIAQVVRFIFANKFESMAIVNEKCEVEYLDNATERFFGIPHASAKGKYINDVIPESGLRDVLRSKTAHIGQVFQVQGQRRIVSRYPLMNRGKMVGAFGKVILHSLEELERVRGEANRLKRRAINAERKILNEYKTKYSFKDILGKSDKIKRAVDMASKMAKAGADVLIQGESGTGKELFAQAIHSENRRNATPFVRVNCPAIPFEMAESELFGYEKGAFTGAKESGKPGKFELAEGGTIFLDEMGALPISIQAKLLRVIQEREIERLGGQKLIRLNFRLIAATNTDLNTMIEQGRFRADLYYRLSKGFLHVPPLRDRPEDIPIYLKHFLNILTGRIGTNVKAVSNEALDSLTRYAWPGNVREFSNILEQAIFRAGSDEVLQIYHLPKQVRRPLEDPVYPLDTGKSLKEKMEVVEKTIITEALEHNNGNKRETARQLGIQRSALYMKLKKYGL